MKILFITNLYPPNAVGGYEKLCFEMASALAAKNHCISVLTSGYGGGAEKYPGQQVDRSLRLLADQTNIYGKISTPVSEKEKINDHNVAVLEKKVTEIGPDVLFVWNMDFFDRSLLGAIQKTEGRRVFFITDNWLILLLKSKFWYRYYHQEIASSRTWLDAARVAFGRLFANIPTGILTIDGQAIFPSRFMHQLYRQAGFRFKETAIIPHGIRFSPRPVSSYRNRMLFYEQSRFMLLLAGRVVEMKGVHTALEALPEIIRALPNTKVRLTVLGDNQDSRYLKRLEKMIQRLGLQQHVVFSAAIAESDLFELFQRHDIFLFPSLYEPFSLTLIHAMASGIPIVASDAGGNPEIVIPEQNGLLFRKGDPVSLTRSVLKLATDSGLRQTVAMGARKTAESFHFENLVNNIEAYLDSVCFSMNG